MSSKDGTSRKAARKSSIPSPVGTAQLLQDDAPRISSSSVDEHFARALSSYKQKKEHGSSTPASPLPLGLQSPRSSGRPAPYHRIRRTNSLPQMQLQQLELENAISQLTGINSISNESTAQYQGMSRSLSASDVYNVGSLNNLISPYPQRQDVSSQDDADLFDLRQLEALLGGGPKQPIYSQAMNDNLFPLSEMDEEATASAMAAPTRSYGVHGVRSLPGNASISSALFSEAQQQLRTVMQSSLGNGVGQAVPHSASGGLGFPQQAQLGPSISSVTGQQPLQLPMNMQYTGNSAGSMLGVSGPPQQLFGNVQQNLSSGIGMGVQQRSFQSNIAPNIQHNVQGSLGSTSLHRQRTLSASGIIPAQPLPSSASGSMPLGAVQMGIARQFPTDTSRLSGNNGMGSSQDLTAKLEGLDMRHDSLPNVGLLQDQSKSLLWDPGNQNQRAIQTPPPLSQSGNGQNASGALGLGADDVELLLSAGIDLYSMLGNNP